MPIGVITFGDGVEFVDLARSRSGLGIQGPVVHSAQSFDVKSSQSGNGAGFPISFEDVDDLLAGRTPYVFELASQELE